MQCCAKQPNSCFFSRFWIISLSMHSLKQTVSRWICNDLKCSEGVRCIVLLVQCPRPAFPRVILPLLFCFWAVAVPRRPGIRPSESTVAETLCEPDGSVCETPAQGAAHHARPAASVSTPRTRAFVLGQLGWVLGFG